MPIPAPSSREDFKIAIICALKLEAKAVLPLFDATYDENVDEYRKFDEDENAYVLGSIGRYHVALVVLRGEGKAHASFASSAAKRSYPSLELALVVGVCGGVPYATDPMAPRRDIFLGDVIVSSGVVQHDLGRRYDGEFIRKDTVHANLGRPSRRILAFVNKLDLVYEQLIQRLASYLVQVQCKFSSAYPGAEKDQLFSPDYPHFPIDCKCAEVPCQDGIIISRRREPGQHHQTTSVHFGLVASGDTVMKSAKHRDQISADENIIAFEMESAGVWDNIPCIVVKGVCDYSDSHKNKDWQFFAAGAAAACARAILDEVPVSLPKPQVEATRNADGEATLSSRKRPAADISEAGLGEIQMDEEFYLDSLTFPQAQFRLEEISTAHKKTCQWIVGQPQYLSWMNEEALSSHGGLFWIKGKPGAGKSTMMKYLLQKARQTLRDSVILFFFFHAQGIILERSVMGMYRSLLHQLLISKKIPSDAKKPFLDLAKGLKPQDGTLIWMKRDVKNLLSLTVKSLQEYRILILIDAVDECNQDEVKDMTSFFQELGRSASASQVNLRICLASRHYPHVTLEKGIELVIEDQQEHGADLEKYIASELKGGKSKPVQRIRDSICTRSSGVFLWVVLVVRMLSEAFDRGKITGLQERLDEIPNGLNALFNDILTRDQKDKDALLFSLQLILFSRRILTREEVYFAALFETTNTIETAIDWDLHSIEAMDRRILDITKGLAEISKAGKTKNKPYRVRFIHESVRDFLLQGHGLSRIRPEGAHPVDFTAMSHENLKDFCFRYISLVWNGLLAQKVSEMGESLLEPEQTIKTSFPFLDYAVRNVLEHSNLAQAGGIFQRQFLETFSTRLPGFKLVFNSVEKFSTRQYKDDASLLYILANDDLCNILPLERLQESDYRGISEQYLRAMGSAFRRGSLAATRALLGIPIDGGVCGLNSRFEPELITAMKLFLTELDDQASKSRLKAKYTQFLLDSAFEGGHVDILRLLLEVDLIDFNQSLLKGKKTPLYWTISNSKPHLVEFLLFEAKVNIEAEIRRAENERRPLLRVAFNKSADGSAPLHARDRGWHAADRRILDILLQQNQNSEDNDGRNAVHWAVLAEDEPSMSRLISHGFNYDHCDSTGRDPLSYATERGYLDIVQTLLQIQNINANKPDLSGRTPALWVLESRWKIDGPAMMETLALSRKVDFNAKDHLFRSVLAKVASEEDRPWVIEFLLGLDAVDVNSRDLYGRTPLILAVLARKVRQVKSLVQCDRVDIDAQDSDGRTALSWAIGPVNFLFSQETSVTASVSSLYQRHGLYDTLIRDLLGPRASNSELADNWGHSPVWWGQVYAIVLSELAREPAHPVWNVPSSIPLPLRCSSVPTDIKSIKTEMQKFLKGEHITKSPCRLDVMYSYVRFGEDGTLKGTVTRKVSVFMFNCMDSDLH